MNLLDTLEPRMMEAAGNARTVHLGASAIDPKRGKAVARSTLRQERRAVFLQREIERLGRKLDAHCVAHESRIKPIKVMIADAAAELILLRKKGD